MTSPNFKFIEFIEFNDNYGKTRLTKATKSTMPRSLTTKENLYNFGDIRKSKLGFTIVIFEKKNLEVYILEASSFFSILDDCTDIHRLSNRESVLNMYTVGNL